MRAIGSVPSRRTLSIETAILGIKYAPAVDVSGAVIWRFDDFVSKMDESLFAEKGTLPDAANSRQDKLLIQLK